MQTASKSIQIRKATLHDLYPLATLLSRAFSRDPFHCWIFPKASQRTKKHLRFFTLSLHRRIQQGTVFTTAELEGVASWIPPEAESMNFVAFLRMGLPYLPLIGKRLPLVFIGSRRILARQPTFPHWYLSILGTDPAHQSQGIGTALLKTGLSRCDSQQAPAYLEATSEAGIKFYQRHGFVVTDAVKLPKGPRLWLMLRQPQ